MKTWYKRQARALYARLIRPLRYGAHEPEYTARGVAVGLFFAFTPTIGVQIAACVLLWTMIRWIRPEWSFNVLVASAWTFVTNVFTAAPVYYVFLVTGRVMMGALERVTGGADGDLAIDEYDQYLSIYARIEATGGGWLASIWLKLVNLFDVFGLPMLLGSLPWALLFGAAGYVWSLRFVRFHRARRRRSLTARRLAAPDRARD